MSGDVPKRVSNTRAAMGTTDQRPAGSGSVMLGLVSSVGRRRALWRATQRRAYTNLFKKECAQGVWGYGQCNDTTFSINISGE